MNIVKSNISGTKSLFIAILFLAAFAERVLFDLGPNVELVTAAMILSAYYIGIQKSMGLTLSIMILSDVILGNSRIFIFTWSGFIIPLLLSGPVLNHLKSIDLAKKLTKLTVTGLAANLFFFFWTNLGVWMLSEMYSKNFTGLIMSYVNAIPFFRNQMISSLLFIPSGFILIQTALSISKKCSFQGKLNSNFELKSI